MRSSKPLTPEFDYPRGNDNVFDFYKGNGGVPVSGFWRRLLFSFYYHDINLLVTENIVPGSRILLRRNISDRRRARSRRFSARIATPTWSCTTAGFTG